MALKVVWTSEALVQLDLVIAYLEANWSEEEIRAFFAELERGIERIVQFPRAYSLSERLEEAREYQLAPQTTIFYTFDDSTLTILLLWPNRMNPQALDES